MLCVYSIDLYGLLFDNRSIIYSIALFNSLSLVFNAIYIVITFFFLIVGSKEARKPLNDLKVRVNFFCSGKNLKGMAITTRKLALYHLSDVIIAWIAAYQAYLSMVNIKK